MNNSINLLQLHSQWLGLQPLPKENHAALWQWIRMRFNHLSNHFEGNTLTYNETQLLLIHGRAAGDHDLREYEEMKAHDVAFDHIQKFATADRPVNEGRHPGPQQNLPERTVLQTRQNAGRRTDSQENHSR